VLQGSPCACCCEEAAVVGAVSMARALKVSKQLEQKRNKGGRESSSPSAEAISSAMGITVDCYQPFRTCVITLSLFLEAATFSYRINPLYIVRTIRLVSVK
jgi:hypothetical protein